MQIKTPAKINPYLKILHRLDDGTHGVDLALVPVSLYDELEFRRVREGGISLSVESAQALGPVEDNLVLRAAKAFEELAAQTQNVRIHLRKHIPAGAGLGGGSGNAAGTLVALNAMCANPLPPEALADAARRLGADVPFFLNPVASRALGRGEQLSLLPGFPRLHLLIAAPPFSISTREAYQGVTSYSPAGEPPPMTTLGEVIDGMENQFEASLFPIHPKLKAAKERLLGAGAAAALLSGSGSALFGVFADREARAIAMEELGLDSSWRKFSCDTLEQHSYLPTGCPFTA